MDSQFRHLTRVFSSGTQGQDPALLCLLCFVCFALLALLGAAAICNFSDKQPRITFTTTAKMMKLSVLLSSALALTSAVEVSLSLLQPLFARATCIDLFFCLLLKTSSRNSVLPLQYTLGTKELLIQGPS